MLYKKISGHLEKTRRLIITKNVGKKVDYYTNGEIQMLVNNY